VGGALVIYVVSRILFEPLIDMRRVIGRIDCALSFYGNLYANPGIGREEDMAAASSELRRLGSELLAHARSVPCFGLFVLVRWLPNLSACRTASQDLIGLSNSVHRGDSMINEKLRKDIQRALGIE
jgi:hypothetical protein